MTSFMTRLKNNRKVWVRSKEKYFAVEKNKMVILWISFKSVLNMFEIQSKIAYFIKIIIPQ
jgi:hypothetical protein